MCTFLVCTFTFTLINSVKMNNFYGNGYTLLFMFSLDLINLHDFNKRYRLKSIHFGSSFTFLAIKKKRYLDLADAYVAFDCLSIGAFPARAFKFINGSFAEGRTVLCGFRRCQISPRTKPTVSIKSKTRISPLGRIFCNYLE